MCQPEDDDDEKFAFQRNFLNGGITKMVDWQSRKKADERMPRETDGRRVDEKMADGHTGTMGHCLSCGFLSK